MRCPGCNFVCSDLRDLCPKCFLDLRPHKKVLGLQISKPDASYDELLGKSPKKKETPKKAKLPAKPKPESKTISAASHEVESTQTAGTPTPEKKSGSLFGSLFKKFGARSAKKSPSSEPTPELKEDAVEAKITAPPPPTEMPTQPMASLKTEVPKMEEAPRSTHEPLRAESNPKPEVMDLSSGGNIDALLDSIMGGAGITIEAETPKAPPEAIEQIDLIFEDSHPAEEPAKDMNSVAESQAKDTTLTEDFVPAQVSPSEVPDSIAVDSILDSFSHDIAINAEAQSTPDNAQEQLSDITRLSAADSGLQEIIPEPIQNVPAISMQELFQEIASSDPEPEEEISAEPSPLEPPMALLTDEGKVNFTMVEVPISPESLPTVLPPSGLPVPIVHKVTEQTRSEPEVLEVQEPANSTEPEPTIQSGYAGLLNEVLESVAQIPKLEVASELAGETPQEKADPETETALPEEPASITFFEENAESTSEDVQTSEATKTASTGEQEGVSFSELMQNLIQDLDTKVTTAPSVEAESFEAATGAEEIVSPEQELATEMPQLLEDEAPADEVSVEVIAHQEQPIEVQEEITEAAEGENLIDGSQEPPEQAEIQVQATGDREERDRFEEQVQVQVLGEPEEQHAEMTFNPDKEAYSALEVQELFDACTAQLGSMAPDVFELGSANLTSATHDEHTELLFNLAYESFEDPAANSVFEEKIVTSDQRHIEATELEKQLERVNKITEITPFTLKEGSFETSKKSLEEVIPDRFRNVTFSERATVIFMDGLSILALSVVNTLFVTATWDLPLWQSLKAATPFEFIDFVLPCGVLAAGFILFSVVYPLLTYLFIGATFGMAQKNLSIRTEDGAIPHSSQLIVRAFSMPLSSAIGGALPILIGRATLHDRLTGTYLRALIEEDSDKASPAGVKDTKI